MMLALQEVTDWVVQNGTDGSYADGRPYNMFDQAKVHLLGFLVARSAAVGDVRHAAFVASLALLRDALTIEDFSGAAGPAPQ